MKGKHKRMKKLPSLLVFFAMFLLLGILPINGCTTPENPDLIVMTSTSLAEYIVRQVGGDKVEVINLVPPTQHPGNFDVKPGDIEKLASARLLLLHGWPGEGYADKLVASANNPNLTVAKVNVDGNWMIPSVQLAATDKIASILSELDAKNASYYTASAAAYQQRIQAEEEKMKAKLSEASVPQINAIASVRQTDFLEWAGVNVTATFGAVNTLTPQIIQQLVDVGKQTHVTLIVNNLQDGPNAGKGIAEELQAKNINLSNFPGGYPDTETWEKAINYNVELLVNMR